MKNIKNSPQYHQEFNSRSNSANNTGYGILEK